MAASRSQFRPPYLALIPLRPLPQRLPLNLARRTLRHLIHKHYPACQILMFRKLALDPLLYLLFARRSFGVECDVRTGVFLGTEGFLDADDAGIGDGGVGEEDGFEFGGGNLRAGYFDEFLLGRVSAILRDPVYEDTSPSIDPQCRSNPDHQ